MAERTVDSWMSRLEPDLRSVAEAIRTLVLEADRDLRESIKWGNPTYEKQGRVCYLAATKSYVSLGFFNVASLTDPRGRIEAKHDIRSFTLVFLKQSDLRRHFDPHRY